MDKAILLLGFLIYFFTKGKELEDFSEKLERGIFSTGNTVAC